jgi:hypothetical protein
MPIYKVPTKQIDEVSNMILTKLVSNFKMLDVKNLEFVLKVLRYNEKNEVDDLEPSKYLSYKLIIKGIEVSFKCPVFRITVADCKEKTAISTTTESTPTVMIRYLPSFLIPRKKYPTYVYLYAVQYYLMNDISMRKVALHVCAKFNLKSFSHSTISRILNKLSFSYEKLTNTFSEGLKSDVSLSFVVRKTWDEAKRLKMQFISRILSSILTTPEITADKLCIEYFSKNEGEFLF